jgi:hypothetical protein
MTKKKTDQKPAEGKQEDKTKVVEKPKVVVKPAQKIALLKRPVTVA